MRLPLVAAVLLATPALAQVELKNDGLTAGGQVFFQNGFVAGEAGAVRLTAPAAGMRLDEVRVMFGGAATTHDVTVKVWDDTAGTVNPGTELFAADYTLTGNDSSFQALGLGPANLTVPQSFRVGVQFMHAGLPSVARDDDGTIDPDRNFVLASDGMGNFIWYRATTLGLTGDLVIRAVVSDPNSDAGTGTDAGAGVDAGTDAGTGLDAGTGTDAGTTTDAGAGCTADFDCAAGTYCDATHHCTFDCRVDTDCGAGGTCSSRGQCLPPVHTGSGCACSSVEFVPFALLALVALGRRTLRRR